MTTSEPEPRTEKTGKHARSDSPDEPPATEEGGETGEAEQEEQPQEPERTEAPARTEAPERTEEPERSEEPRRSRWSRFRPGGGSPLGRHPGGTTLLMSAGLLLGLFLSPTLFDQLDFDVFDRAARAARSAATEWPGGGEPWFWPSWVAALAGIVALALLVLALVGVRLPDLLVGVLAVVLAVTTARAAWATLAVVNARLWDLIATCLVCLIAFGLAVSGVAQWRAPDPDGQGSGVGAAANAVVGGVIVALLIVIGGAGIARFQEEGRGPAGPPQKVAGLLSIRAADVAVADDLDGPWVPQVAAQQLGDDDAAATAFSTSHRGWTARFPALLLRGDDVRGDLGDGWWLTVAAQGFRSEVEAQEWCATNGIAGCVPIELAG